MELGEATALADRFVTSLVVKIHSLPLSDRSASAGNWWRSHGSRIPLRPALEEERRHLSIFASRRRSEKRSDRQLFLMISAIVDDHGRGHCPALNDNKCGIYETRPLTCRTVPLHYSRPPSVLGNYLDRFTGTPGYECDTSDEAPSVLDGNAILDPAIGRYREEAVAVAKSEKAWKDHIVYQMDDEARAQAAQLPTYAAVLASSDNGYATTLPMIVAWRAAKTLGIMSAEQFADLCRKQALLIKAEIAREPARQSLNSLLENLVLYEKEMATPATAATNLLKIR